MRRHPSAGANKVRSWIITARLCGHPMSGYNGSFAENNCSAIMRDKIEKHVKLHLLPQEIHLNGFAVCLWHTICSGILPSSLNLFL
jgi:hypothetical protein